jgi:SpoVK/Ycf46/Vps4 family AAA+-type ATPase
VASPDAEKFFLANCAGLSGADIEAVLIRARMRAALASGAAVGLEDLKAALEDFIPPSYPTEIELQNLAAVLECTSRSLLPEKYRNADRAELIRRANELAGLVRD